MPANIELNKVYNEDCLEGMKRIADKSVDMILCDLPYGNKVEKAWDVIIPFDSLWEQYERIITDVGAIVLTSIQPFTTQLIASNMKLFKYALVWEKDRPSGFAQAKNMPLKTHEDICIFSKGATVHESQSDRRMTYNPQGLQMFGKIKKNGMSERSSVFGARENRKDQYVQEYTNYPRSVLRFNCETDTFHPTQKPVGLFSYLIRTFTQEGDLVLDNCMGSGTTAVSCIKTKRKFIGFEMDEDMFNKADARIKRERAVKIDYSRQEESLKKATLFAIYQTRNITKEELS